MTDYGEVSFKIRFLQKGATFELLPIKAQGKDTYKKVEKITTRFKVVIDEDKINKAFFNTKVDKVKRHITYKEIKMSSRILKTPMRRF